ncbi:MAG: hypothetical protein QOH68_1846 [Nocardioidaceae bacterium]|nr:hypothetical protein [Nocardioidaceae bacterium]
MTVLTGLLVLATLLGAWHVAASTTARLDPMSLQVDETTFTVTHVERVTGLTADDLGGMAHGIQGLVQEDQTMLRVSVTVAAGDEDTTFDVGSLRLFSSASKHAIRPVGGSLGRGRLGAKSLIEGAVSFVVPRNGARFVLRSRGSEQSVFLTRVDKASPGSGGMHMQRGTDPDHHH